MLGPACCFLSVSLLPTLHVCSGLRAVRVLAVLLMVMLFSMDVSKQNGVFHLQSQDWRYLGCKVCQLAEGMNVLHV